MRIVVYYSHTSLVKYVKQEMLKSGLNPAKIEEEVAVGNRRVDIMYSDTENPIAFECKSFKHTEEGLASYAAANPTHKRVLVMPMFSADEIWLIGSEGNRRKIVRVSLTGALTQGRSREGARVAQRVRALGTDG